jgi:DNA polymerase III delta prime subunit
MIFPGIAQLVAGTDADIPALLSLLRDSGIAVEGNPDLYVRTYTHFGIDEARDLRERALCRPIGERRVFVLSAPSLTHEAQNALLKTLEEPPAGALFIIIVASPESLLPTLRSRTQSLSVGASHAPSVIDVTSFLSSRPDKRLEMLKPLFEKDEEDRRDASAILAFLSALEAMLAPRVSETGVKEGIESVYRARAYVSDKGALVKPLLEHVALLIPVVKK